MKKIFVSVELMITRIIDEVLTIWTTYSHTSERYQSVLKIWNIKCCEFMSCPLEQLFIFNLICCAYN